MGHKPYSPGNPRPARNRSQRQPHWFDDADIAYMAIRRWEQERERGPFSAEERADFRDWERRKEEERDKRALHWFGDF